MDFKEHLLTAWNLTLKFIVPLVLLTLVMGLVSVVSLGILMPVVVAGYMQAILEMLREGREPKIGDLFTQMSLFLPLLAFGVVVFIVVAIGSMLFVLPGILISIAVAYLCLYMMPLMTDRRLGLVEAIKESVAMTTTGNIGEQVVVALLFYGISQLGSFVLVGVLFTHPLATVFLLSVYEELISGSSALRKTTKSFG